MIYRVPTEIDAELGDFEFSQSHCFGLAFQLDDRGNGEAVEGYRIFVGVRAGIQEHQTVADVDFGQLKVAGDNIAAIAAWASQGVAHHWAVISISGQASA